MRVPKYVDNFMNALVWNTNSRFLDPTMNLNCFDMNSMEMLQHWFGIANLTPSRNTYLSNLGPFLLSAPLYFIRHVVFDSNGRYCYRHNENMYCHDLVGYWPCIMHGEP
jgi:hypothetical protein